MERLCSPLALALLAITLLQGAQGSWNQSGCWEPGLGRIMGGQDAKKGNWPWQVSVQEDGAHICGGSLISAQWVVSAAHCFNRSLPDSAYRMNLGEYQLSNPSPTQISSPVNRIIIHPNYNESTDIADIALVQLTEPVTFTDEIRPISLPGPPTQFPAGDVCWVTGWGRTGSAYTLPLPQTLQEVQVPLVDVSTCREHYGECSLGIEEDMLCAGSLGVSRDSCKGDSGGPLVCPRNGNFLLAGIVSWGANCTDSSTPSPGVYTQVSFYANWIQEALQEVQVQLIDTAACNTLYNINPAPNIGRDPVKPDMICAGYAEGQRDSCQGDSGGPLACDYNGTWFLMGSVSWGDGCGQPNRPSIYVRTVAYGEWIWGHVVSGGQATTMENSTSGINDARPSFSTYTLLFTTLLMSL
ncbi:serine protease 27-like [Emys orbicularis]|uniref:serine protease 27-like n=1 Tax=Emys orbicularis TaxID=82168 RepID=UPI0031FC4567